MKADTKTIDEKKRLDDGGGLYLLLEVKGGGWAWRFDYTCAGKRKTISLGTYPDTTLKLARQQADTARKQVATGIDPGEVRKAKKSEQKAIITAERRESKGLPPLARWRMLPASGSMIALRNGQRVMRAGQWHTLSAICSRG